MSKKLSTIRNKIDKLDNTIHDVLMERAALIDSIAEEKRKNNLDFVQPAREAQMIRRLLARHKGILPDETIVHIWRELVGSVSLLQTGLSISVCMEDLQDFKYWQMARNYFGNVVHMKSISSTLLTLTSLREGHAAFAVLPWPQDTVEQDALQTEYQTLPWWTHLLNQEQNHDMQIVCALPYGVRDLADGSKTTPTGALVVSKTAFMPSGEDNSFLLIRISRQTSRAKIVEALENAELIPISIHTAHDYQSENSYHIIELSGYVTREESGTKLHALEAALDDPIYKGLCIGGYPVPPVFKKRTEKS